LAQRTNQNWAYAHGLVAGTLSAKQKNLSDKINAIFAKRWRVSTQTRLKFSGSSQKTLAYLFANLDAMNIGNCLYQLLNFITQHKCCSRLTFLHYKVQKCLNERTFPATDGIAQCAD